MICVSAVCLRITGKFPDFDTNILKRMLKFPQKGFHWGDVNGPQMVQLLVSSQCFTKDSEHSIVRLQK